MREEPAIELLRTFIHQQSSAHIGEPCGPEPDDVVAALAALEELERLIEFLRVELG